MIGAVVAAALWIRREPPPPAPQPPTHPAFSSIAVGVAGWLLLFTIGQVVTPLIVLARSNALMFASNPLWNMGRAGAMFRPLIMFERGFFLAKLAVPIIGVALIVKRSRFAPRFWVAFFAYATAFIAFDLVADWVLVNQLVREFGAEITATFRLGASNALTSNLRGIAFSLIWGAYWTRSVRVRATFGSGGLDRGVVALVAPVSAPQPAEMTETGPTAGG